MPNELGTDATTTQMVQETPTKSCDLCGGHEFERIAEQDRVGKPLSTVICMNCGLVAHEQIPSEDELAAFYGSRYRREYHGEGAPSSRRVMRAWKKAERIFGELSQWVEPGSQVFEVGAGLGCNVKVFDLGGFPASGIEPGNDFQAFSQQQLQANVQNRSVFDLPEVPVHDLVLLIHVIEHFRSPRAALTQIHKILKPGGKLYVECPSLCRVHADRSQLFHYAHIHNFTWPTLLMMARSCGFQVDRVLCTSRASVLRAMFVKCEPTACQVDPKSYQQTLKILQEFRRPDYRWQTNYVQRRFEKISKYVYEYLLAPVKLKQILQTCRTAPVTLSRAA